jgi:hypothetical protein
LVTLASAHSIGLSDDSPVAARSRTAYRSLTSPAPRKPWWKWFDFDSKLLAQVWFICSAQIVIFVVGGLVIHASAASPY